MSLHVLLHRIVIAKLETPSSPNPLPSSLRMRRLPFALSKSPIVSKHDWLPKLLPLMSRLVNETFNASLRAFIRFAFASASASSFEGEAGASVFVGDPLDFAPGSAPLDKAAMSSAVR